MLVAEAVVRDGHVPDDLDGFRAAHGTRVHEGGRVHRISITDPTHYLLFRVELGGDPQTIGGSLPERTVLVDPTLVREANDELAAEWRTLMQENAGVWWGGC